jgi:two-component system LytT family sensor kinase
MAMSREIKKQVWVALYSSLAISVLTTTPVFMMTRVSFAFYPWALLFTMALTLVMWGLNILLFFIIGAGRLSRYLLSYVVVLTFGIGAFHGLMVPHTGRGLLSGMGFHFHVILFFAVNTVLLIVQDLVVVRGRKAAMELENAQLRMRNMEAVNLQLQQQVQPHFLFNSLSTLKSLIRYSPADAEAYLVRLAGFLRSAIASHASALVKVEEELSLCTDYLEMQRMRFGEALRFSVEVAEEVRRDWFLPVFSLQVLVENAIKHNVLTKERPLDIRVVGEGRVIRVVNNLQERDIVEDAGGVGDAATGMDSAATGVDSAATGGSGIGLVNLRERYKALGGEDIVVVKSETEFSVSITVLQYEDSDH